MRTAKRRSARSTWRDRGFYMVLILCAAAIGISGYLLFFQDQRSALDDLTVPALWEEESSAASTTAEAITEPILVELPDSAKRESRVVMAEDYLAEVAGKMEPTESEELLTGGEPEDPTPAGSGKVIGEAEPVSSNVVLEENPAANPPEETAEVVAPFFVWPVNGEILSDFSTEELVFNATTEDWRVHTGVDIAAPMGTLVSAIGDGVVEDVYEDELMGWTVVIHHGDGLRSVSCGLMSDIPVSIGETVRAGTVIGGVGGPEALPVEAGISSHLHLECIGNGAQFDPLELLP